MVLLAVTIRFSRKKVGRRCVTPIPDQSSNRSPNQCWRAAGLGLFGRAVIWDMFTIDCKPACLAAAAKVAVASRRPSAIGYVKYARWTPSSPVFRIVGGYGLDS